MANWQQSIEYVLDIEGGYVFDPDDPGGETYRGIARKFHPNWRGWKRIDDLKFTKDFRGIRENDDLTRLALDFYWHEYWIPLRGAEIQSDEIALELLDQGVHLGKRRAVEHMQEACNLLNRNELSWADMVVDGILGPVTLKLVNGLSNPDRHKLRKLMDGFQAKYYIERAQARPVNEKYLRGWLERVAA